mmetsp:Transcript_113924/g.322206  ORF Transcript_113924/g.322206 Transcript_113924/m.322206 type:complete len:250 (-) Transcript_113924:237-986(-)
MQGCLTATLMASTPTCWSKLSSRKSLSFREAWISAAPPPGTMPSSSAAFVAQSASFSRSLTSFTSTSLAPPTLITATPPLNFASRSFILSLSYSEVLASIPSRIDTQRSSMLSAVPAPSRMTVSSLAMVTVFAAPSCSIVTSSSLPPISSDTSSAPVSTAISCMIALRLSPKPGAFTAATFRPPRSLLTINKANASPSTSSAISNKGRCNFATCSRSGSIACTEEIFLSKTKTSGFSISTFCVFASVTK